LKIKQTATDTNKMKKKEAKVEDRKKTETADAMSNSKKETAEKISTRGRTFEGRVIRKFPKRVVIAFERMIYVRKYERYARAKTKIHARLPASLEKEINLGDLIKVRECRPLSKMIHFMVIQKIKDSKEVGK